MTLAMEDIAFSDWPGQPVDLSGSNPWLPAYGFQPPHALLDKDDFLGNPDADLFLSGSAVRHLMYLETIQEETSDDLRSESDFSGSRSSYAGWLATDSESGSVIRLDKIGLDEIDSDSEREIACPAKRRRQENPIGFSDDDSSHSLSRSSSLLQFETLEKQCQDVSSSSPSILSTFSFDSLENQRKNGASPDSLEQGNSDCEPESDYYKTLKVDLPRTKRNTSRDSLLYNATRLSDSDSSESADSERTLDALQYDTSRSMRPSRSFDNLNLNTNGHFVQKATREKMSAENLSEDSGYSDHLCNFIKNKSNSNPNMAQGINYIEKSTKKYSRNVVYTDYDNNVNYEMRHDYSGFYAYDGECNFQNFGTTFGSSYHDLTILDKYDVSSEYRSPLIERFMRNGAAKWRAANTESTKVPRTDAIINIEKASECVRTSKYNSTSASEPNLLQPVSCDETGPADTVIGRLNDQFQQIYGKQCYFENSVCVSSVPKDLNLAGDLKCNKDDWSLDFTINTPSIAAQNWDIADFANTRDSYNLTNGDSKQTVMDMSSKTINLLNKSSAFTTFKKQDSISSGSDIDMASFKREGSYLEAMSNRVDLSDDEYNPCYLENINKSTIVEFDKKILKTISETSIGSFNNSNSKLDLLFTSTPITAQKRNVVSTPNLTALKSEVDNFDQDLASSSQNLPQKSALVNRSTSTSGVSDDEKTLTSSKSFSGSASSKGVHFCPVVSEVNWRDDSESTTEKESSYSLSSTPEIENDMWKKSPPPIVRPKPRLPSPVAPRMSTSQPELQNVGDKSDAVIQTKTDVEYIYIPLKPRSAVSQPEISGAKRRGSQVIRKDQEGGVMRTYVDGDGITYKHTHLGDVYQSMSPTPNSHVSTGSMPEARLEKEKLVVGTTPVSAMEADTVRRDTKSTRSSKLGGFFSRIASFRFSTRKNAEEKNKPKKKAPPETTKSSKSVSAATPQPRIASKDDYIYIPLKGPIEEKPQNNNKFSKIQVDGRVIPDDGGRISAKPPLPKLPPRVVGASVKKRVDTSAQLGAPEYRTIDSGDALPRPMEPMGLIETDLDTEVTVITSGAHVKTRSLMNLGAEAPPRSLAAPPHPARPHKSMEFLLDKQNLKVVEPPENELQKGERVMSEHQLRVQRSLQKLTIPDWYKQSQVPREGFLLKKNSTRERWTGTSSKTPSLSSLGSSSHSPVVLSPVPHSQPFVRWSTSKLNSTASSPCASTRSSFNARQPNGSISPSSVRSSFSYRQPYLGWRSQERLTRPRTPAERLASSLLAQSHAQQVQHESPEIQTSIKEVTSAIVHYVSGLRPEARDGSDGQDGSNQRSRSVSPRGSQKLCWLESSFVGTRPLDSPQTPNTLAESSSPAPPSSLRLDLQTHNGESVRT